MGFLAQNTKPTRVVAGGFGIRELLQVSSSGASRQRGHNDYNTNSEDNAGEFASQHDWIKSGIAGFHNQYAWVLNAVRAEAMIARLGLQNRLRAPTNVCSTGTVFVPAFHEYHVKMRFQQP